MHQVLKKKSWPPWYHNLPVLFWKQYIRLTSKSQHTLNSLVLLSGSVCLQLTDAITVSSGFCACHKWFWQYTDSLTVKSRAKTLFVFQSLGVRCGSCVIMSVPCIMYEKCAIIIAIVKRNYMVACIVRVVLKRVRVNLVLKDNILHTV